MKTIKEDNAPTVRLNISIISRYTFRVAIGMAIFIMITNSIASEDINLSIISPLPETDPTTVLGTPQTFSIDTNKEADIIWMIDESIVKNETNVTISNYTSSTTGIGKHNVNVTANNGTETISKIWTWIVNPIPTQTIYIPPTPIITDIVTENFWIRYTLQPGIGENNTDSYNITTNGVSVNETTDTDFNHTVGPHGIIDLTAFAYNNSGGTSLTPVVEHIQIANNIPIQEIIGDKTTTVGQLLTFTVSASDDDTADVIIYTTSATKGELDSSTGVYLWTPGDSDVGTYTWSFCSNDNYGGTDCETINIEVIQLVYMPPTPTDLICGQGNFWINCAWSPGIGNKTDIYYLDIDGESISVIEDYYNFSVGPHAQRNISVRAYNNSGNLNDTPVSEFVQLVNNDPIQNSIGDQIVIIGQLLMLTISATDEDGDFVTYNTNATKGLWDSNNGSYSWYPDNKDIGKYSWTFCSKDNYGGSDCEDITVDVNTTSLLKVNIIEPKQNRSVRYTDNIVKGEVIGIAKYSVLNVKNKDNTVVSSYNLTPKIINNKFIQRVEYVPNQKNTLELIAIDDTDNMSKNSIYVNIGDNMFESTRQINIGDEMNVDARNETDTNITLFPNISSLVTFKLLAITNVTEIDGLNNNASINSEFSLGRIVDIQIDGINVSEDIQNVTINLFYTKKDLDLDGDNKLEVGELDEDKISLYWYDINNNNWKKLLKGDPQWVIDNGIVKMTNNSGYVWIKGKHLSRFALVAGTKLQSPGRVTGGSGGGGSISGGLSGEKISNIEVKEKYESDIYANTTTNYTFSHPKNPIMFVNITGNIRAEEVTATVEVLKNRSTLIKTSPPGLVYKNVNIWVSPSSFIKRNGTRNATITFRVENSWIDNNSMHNYVTLAKIDRGKWVTLATSEIMKNDNYTYFKANATEFSQFAITGLKKDNANKSISTTNKIIQTPDNSQIQVDKQTDNKTISHIRYTGQFGEFGIALLIIILIASVIYIIRQKE